MAWFDDDDDKVIDVGVSVCGFDAIIAILAYQVGCSMVTMTGLSVAYQDFCGWPSWRLKLLKEEAFFTGPVYHGISTWLQAACELHVPTLNGWTWRASLDS
jgi:hypothetical protein